MPSEIQDQQHDHEGGVQVIARAAEILRALKAQGLSLSQIAREVGLARSTVRRIVSALAAEDFVTSASPEGGVRLGPGLIPLAAWVNSELRDQLRPYLERLSREVDETVDLAVLDRDRVFFIDHVAVPHRLQVASGIGVTFPVYCTAHGKALLAELPIEQVEHMLPEQFKALTPATITTRELFLVELGHIRSGGVAFEREEYTPGVCAAGKAVRHLLGNLVVITIVAPAVRFYGDEQHLSSALFHICTEIQQHVQGLSRPPLQTGGF